MTDQPFGGMIDYFQKKMGQTIILDKPSLDDLNINSEATKVSLHLDKVSTRTALKKMLADLGLTYIVKDEAIFVTTPVKARDSMTTRTYYIGDLAPQYDLRFGPYLRAATGAANHRATREHDHEQCRQRQLGGQRQGRRRHDCV